MADIFNAKTGHTIITLPAFMALAVCKVLDVVRGGLHDFDRRT